MGTTETEKKGDGTMKKGMLFGLVLAGMIVMSGAALAGDYWETTYERTSITTHYPAYPFVESRTYYVSGPTYVVESPTYVRRTYISHRPSYTSRTYVSYGPSYRHVDIRSHSFDW